MLKRGAALWVFTKPLVDWHAQTIGNTKAMSEIAIVSTMTVKTYFVNSARKKDCIRFPLEWSVTSMIAAYPHDTRQLVWIDVSMSRPFRTQRGSPVVSQR